jgi:hypothetical protein
MKYLLIFMVLAFAIPARADSTTAELSAYITDFLSRKIGGKKIPLYPKRLAIALNCIPTIIAECGSDIDPLLIVVLITKESSWRPKIEGKLGEYGLMQVMPRYAKGYHLENPLEQIRAGIDHLRKAIKRCGNIMDAVNAYGCGRCRPHCKFLKRRWKYYQRMKRKYRDERKNN